MQANIATEQDTACPSTKLTPLVDSTSYLSSDDTLDRNINSKNLIQPHQIHLKHSMSDDEISYHGTSHDDDSKTDDKIHPLLLRNTVSANVTKRKRKKGRSNSAFLGGNTAKYNKRKTLKIENKLQKDKLRVYQIKINEIQDEREELERSLKKEYELKILHLETKYHLEKGEKDTLQHENEKLRQELFLKDRELQHMQSIASGYSTGSMHGGSPTTANAQIPMIQMIPNQSAQTMVTHHSQNSISRLSQVSQVSHPSQQSPKYQEQSSESESVSSSHSSLSSNSSTNSSESNSDSESDSSSDDDTYSSSDTASTVTTNSNDDHVKIDKESKNERKHKKRKSKNKKISKQLNRKIEKQQPKGFWSTVWSLFGPPELMCSCSDNKK